MVVRPAAAVAMELDIEMKTRRVTGGMQLTTMSTKATAFMIDELLRPDLHMRADNNNADSRRQMTTHETTISRTTECRPRASTGNYIESVLSRSYNINQ